jgi:hypothetical protein
MQATDLSSFHRWLLADASAGASSIVVDGHPPVPAGLAPAVARHLNEFDEDASGNWISFTPDLIERIAGSETQRCLLGLEDFCQCGKATADCHHVHETLTGLAAHGRVVLEGAVAFDACSGKPNIFRVWLGSPPDGSEAMHLILHPEHFSGHSLPAIIGDTFLEWSCARLAPPPR